MGAAAYNRGSAAIAKSIQLDFMESRGGYRRQLAGQMERAEYQVIALETFCRDAQSLYVEAIDETSAKGLLMGWMHQVWLKKRNSITLAKMLNECNEAHCAWLDSDHRQVFSHLAVCRRKAKAWFNVIEYLNSNKAVYPFPVPPITK